MTIHLTFNGVGSYTAKRLRSPGSQVVFDADVLDQWTVEDLKSEVPSEFRWTAQTPIGAITAPTLTGLRERLAARFEQVPER